MTPLRHELFSSFQVVNLSRSGVVNLDRPKVVKINRSGVVNFTGFCTTVSFVTNFQTNFNSDDATLSDQDKNSLRGVASVLEWLPNAHITITAFTDNTNTPEYNFALSQKRADACKVYLESLGIPSSSVTAIGGGPINTGNESSEGKKANRKATIGIN